MVLDYYKLQEQPFGVTPDSRYLVLTPTHKEALDSLIYGIESGCGFVALIATPGLGKTTLLFEALSILRDKARIVFLFQTISTPLDLLRALLSGLEEEEAAALGDGIEALAALTKQSAGATASAWGGGSSGAIQVALTAMVAAAAALTALFVAVEFP